MATASTALTANTDTAVARNDAASTGLIFGIRRHVLQSSRQSPIHAVTPASAGSGMCDTAPEPNDGIAPGTTACTRFATLVVPPQRTTARLRAGMPTLSGAPNTPAQRLAIP